MFLSGIPPMVTGGTVARQSLGTLAKTETKNGSLRPRYYEFWRWTPPAHTLTILDAYRARNYPLDLFKVFLPWILPW